MKVSKKIIVSTLLIIGLCLQGCGQQPVSTKENEQTKKMEKQVCVVRQTEKAAANHTEEPVKVEMNKEARSVTIPNVNITPKKIPDTQNQRFVQNMKVGWNLGNTFDAYTDGQLQNDLDAETMWCHVKTSKRMIDMLKEAGFQTLRLPVSWHNHVSGDNYTINAAWMNRVQEVVDYAIANDMYVILNIHHDTAYNYCYPDNAHLDNSLKYMTSIWQQIGERFRNYGESLIFERINEPRLVGTSYEWNLDMNNSQCVEAVNCINQWNQKFVDVVRASGGNNKNRYLMVPGYDASEAGVMTDKFVVPKDKTGRVMVSVHAYIPYNFALQAPNEYGSTSVFRASSKESTKAIDDMMENLYKKFVNKKIPVVIGEFGARDKGGNLSDRVEYAAYYTAAARAYGMSCSWWDNNEFSGNGELFGVLDRAREEWRYPQIVQAMMKYAK